MAVCRKTYEIFSRPPYDQYFEGVEPLQEVDEPPPFPCTGETFLRHPCQTKGQDHDLTTEVNSCLPGECC